MEQLKDFQHYYRNDELKDFLDEKAAKFPQLVRLDVAGKSYEGRDIWAVTLTNHDSGLPEHKPAIYIDGNIHAGEVTAAMTCLKLIDYLTVYYGHDETVTKLLDEKTFYILPRISPDGAEKYLTTPVQLRSSTRYYPDENADDWPGLHAQDINDDGMILKMRLRDDERGAWKISKKDSRVMLPRLPGENDGEFYHMLPEGLIKDFKADFSVNKTPYGLDLNRNFPSNFDYSSITAGRYPGSEPESRTIIEFISSHPNIGLLNCFHTSGGLFFRNPYTYGDDQMDQEDLRATKEIASRGFAATGYTDVKSNNRSTLTEWVYEHLGIIGYTTELWDRATRAGLTRQQLETLHSEEDLEAIELAYLRWNDREISGKGFIPWRKFKHPQLGEVEIGGWDPKFTLQNPPPALLNQECHKNALWAINQALCLPQAEVRVSNTEKLSDDIYKITVEAFNTGYLPTNITNKGKKSGAVKNDRLKISAQEGEFELLIGSENQEIGFLPGYFNSQIRRTITMHNYEPNIHEHSFLIKKKSPVVKLEIELDSQRGGKRKTEVTI